MPQAGAAGPVSAPDLVVRFRDEHGELADVHDFTRLMLPPGIAPLIAEAFRAHYQGAAAGSRHGAYKALRTFACFLAADGWVAEPEDLDSRAIERYVAWLGGQRRRDVDQPRSPAARAQLYAVVRQLLLWTRRHRPGLLPRIDFPANPFPRRAAQTTPRPRLDDDQLKTVLEACYAEIDDAWSRFEAGRRMLAGDMAEDELAKMVRAVHAVGDGVVPSGKALRAGGLPFSRVAGVGGLRIVAQYLHLTPETLAPFYVALAIQIAANPEPLRLIRRDCLVPHPLDEDRAFVDWVKPRAGGSYRRPQRRSFDLRRPRAAPHLVRHVLAMTGPLVPHAGRERDRLFLTVSEKSGRVGVVNQAVLSQLIKRFICRANDRVRVHSRANPARPRDPLPSFAAASLRASVAEALYRASGGDIVAVKDVLNHASAATTEAYVAGPRTTRLREATIARAQRLLVAWATGSGPDAGLQTGARDTAVTAPARGTAHDCLDPLGGTGPAAEPGRACPRLGGCLVCPGLVIPLDAEHLARLLQLRRTLEEARERLDPLRWRLIYAPSHRAVVEDILPDFPDHLAGPARALAAALPPLPALE